MTGEWAFLVDEMLQTAIARRLRDEGFRAEHVTDALEPGADDTDDVLPYAVAEDMLLVTNDRDFVRLPYEAHPGVLVLYDDRYPPRRVVAGILSVVDAYPDRDHLRHAEPLDDWV